MKIILFLSALIFAGCGNSPVDLNDKARYQMKVKVVSLEAPISSGFFGRSLCSFSFKTKYGEIWKNGIASFNPEIGQIVCVQQGCMGDCFNIIPCEQMIKKWIFLKPAFSISAWDSSSYFLSSGRVSGDDFSTQVRKMRGEKVSRSVHKLDYIGRYLLSICDPAPTNGSGTMNWKEVTCKKCLKKKRKKWARVFERTTTRNGPNTTLI